jgi:hypothetical protein
MIVTQQTFGGMAQFETAPRIVTVTVEHRGPEVVEYVNTQEDFELMVNYQPFNGQIGGTFTGEISGQRVQIPVACSTTTLW